MLHTRIQEMTLIERPSQSGTQFVEANPVMRDMSRSFRELLLLQIITRYRTQCSASSTSIGPKRFVLQVDVHGVRNRQFHKRERCYTDIPVHIRKLTEFDLTLETIRK